MKKLIIILSSIIIIVAVAIGGIMYYKSFHRVTFTLSGDVSRATLYLADRTPVNDELSGKKIDEFTANKVISLQDGKYYIVPKGEHIQTTEIPFDVEGNEKAVAIQPDYTSKYLASISEKELVKITALINAKFPFTKSSYVVTNGSLFGKAQWYGGLLAQSSSDTKSEPDFYRFVAKKENESWKIIGTPMLVLTGSDFPSVPFDILSEINRLVL